MTFRILWPTMRWPDKRDIEIESVGNGAATEFRSTFEKVTDEEWAGWASTTSISRPQNLVNGAYADFAGHG